ncbi:MAG: response regulator [Longimicrobiales bacterium]
MARVLIVDDDEGARFILGRFAEDAGHFVAYAHEGNNALQMMAQSPYDAIVADLAMPGMNGLTFIRDLRSRGDATPVIAVTGYGADHLMRAKRFGADRTLMKPVRGHELRAALGSVLRHTGQSAWDLVVD